MSDLHIIGIECGVNFEQIYKASTTFSEVVRLLTVYETRMFQKWVLHWTTSVCLASFLPLSHGMLNVYLQSRRSIHFRELDCEYPSLPAVEYDETGTDWVF